MLCSIVNAQKCEPGIRLDNKKFAAFCSNSIKLRDGRRDAVYRIGVLAEEKKEGQEYEKRIRGFCSARGIFPELKTYWNQETFFEQIQRSEPTSVFLALRGVAGLNAAEHLRSLYPRCGLVWCSDLDFSLHAFRLRVEYFFKEPIDEKTFEEGMTVWLERRSALREKGAHCIEQAAK